MDQLPLFDDEARARSTDPDTSHEAAESLTSDRIRQSQADVLAVMTNWAKPLPDALLVELYDICVAEGFVSRQSPSGIRTRRKELVVRGAVVDSGERVLLDSGRRAIAWAVAA